MISKKKVIAFLGIVCTTFLLILLFNVPGKNYERPTVTIAIPYNKFIRDLNTNYYKEWLEEKSGLSIRFKIVSEEQSEQYLKLMFLSENSDLDAVFFDRTSEGFSISQEEIQDYAKAGYILPLDDYIFNRQSNLGKILAEFTEYDLIKAMSDKDGHIYYMPSLNTAQLTGRYQVLWMNTSWLKNLGLKIPTTTEEFRNVLMEFKLKDPNGNGIQDEIPVASCNDIYTKQVYNYLINSFVYNDTQNMRMFVSNSQVVFAPTTDEWRQAVIYLSELYKERLLPEINFSYNENQLTQLANDARNVVGAFTSVNIADVIFKDSTEILNDFIHIAPLEGPNDTINTPVISSLPKPAGLISTNCKNPDAVFNLMDLMLSKEAFLIATYGEQGVDWDFAKAGDISVSGDPATIHVKTRLADKIQNKNFASIGPIFIPSKYTDGITWSGLQANDEYINNRANELYKQHGIKERLPPIFFEGNGNDEKKILRKNIEAYTDSMLEAFITGKKDINDDNDWNEYISGYELLELNKVQAFIQQTYYKSKVNGGIR